MKFYLIALVLISLATTSVEAASCRVIADANSPATLALVSMHDNYKSQPGDWRNTDGVSELKGARSLRITPSQPITFVAPRFHPDKNHPIQTEAYFSADVGPSTYPALSLEIVSKLNPVNQALVSFEIPADTVITLERITTFASQVSCGSETYYGAFTGTIYRIVDASGSKLDPRAFGGKAGQLSITYGAPLTGSAVLTMKELRDAFGTNVKFERCE